MTRNIRAARDARANPDAASADGNNDARAARLSQLFSAISETNKAVLRSAGPEAVYRAVCDACVRHGGFRLAWIGVHDPVSDYIIPVEAAGAASSFLDAIGPGAHPDVPARRPGWGPERRAFREQRVCLCEDLGSDAGFAAWHAIAAAHGLTCAVSLPLRRDDAPFGTLTVYGAEKHCFDSETVSLLEDMADSISFALDHFARELRRRQAENALRASEARLQEAQAVGSIGDWEVDRDSGTMSWSPQLFRLFERPLDAGPPDLNEGLAYFEPLSLERTRTQFWHAIDTGECCEVEQTVCLPSGATRYHATRIVPQKDATGRVRKLFGTVQDITERKLAEQKLRRTSDEIEDLYQNAPCGYHSVDAEGRFLRINDTELRWLGYTRDEMVGTMNIRDLLSADGRKGFDEQFSLFKKTGVITNLPFEYVRKDGTHLPVLLSSTAIVDADGNFVASRTITSDNSTFKRLAVERTVHAARLADLSRHMVEVQENERRKLAAELHDRASPNLAALHLTLSNLARALPAPMAAELEPLLSDAQALLLDTTAGIREICADLRPATLDYAGLMPALHDYAQQFAQRTGVAVHLDTDGFSVTLAPDVQSLLFRIAQEALTNCAKHAAARTACIRLAKTDTHLGMKISDDGVGFDPASLGGAGSAPGLGLITMKERAEFAGGRFTIHSTPSMGTEITVTFDLDVLDTRRNMNKRRRLVDHQPGLAGQEAS